MNTSPGILTFGRHHVNPSQEIPLGQRKSISARARFEVFKRDEFSCGYCGRTPPEVTLQVDHVLPVCEGGGNDPENLLTACSECNGGKGPVPLSARSRPLEETQREARERAAQIDAYNAFLRERRELMDAHIRDLEEVWYEEANALLDDDCWCFPAEKSASLRMFLRRLPFETVRSAMELAISRVRPSGRCETAHGSLFWDTRRRWKYFCKVCWNQSRGEGAPL